MASKRAGEVYLCTSHYVEESFLHGNKARGHKASI